MKKLIQKLRIKQKIGKKSKNEKNEKEIKT